MDWYKHCFLGLFIYLAFLPALVLAQNIPTIDLSRQQSAAYITDAVSIILTDDKLSAEEAWNRLESSGQTNFKEFGFTNQKYWMGVRFTDPSEAQRWLIEISSPHIDFIDYYVRTEQNDQWTAVEKIGDRRPYHLRTINHYNPVLPLVFENASVTEVLVKLHKRNASINFDIQLWEQNDFSSYQQIRYLAHGSYFGIILLVITGIFITFLFSGKRIYLWYFLYLLVAGFYILDDIGLGHQFIYPGSDTIPSNIRVLMVYGFIFTFLPFTQHFFSTSVTKPKVHKGFNILIGIALLHWLITYAFSVDRIVALTSQNILLLACQVFAIYHGLVQLRINRTRALFYLGAFSAIIFAGGYIVLKQFGLLPEINFRFTVVQIAFFTETIILTIALGWEIQRLNQQQVEFQARIRKMKSEKLKAYINGVDEERSRIAMDLHDAIGNRLTQLKQLTKNFNSDKVQNLIKQTYNEIRNISHQLSPPGLELTDLEQNIKKLVSDVDEKYEIDLRLQILDMPSDLSTDFATHIYRLIQEGINNIVKHSKAHHADIQLIVHDNQLVLSIEDDGVGMAQEQKKKGIGLNNLRQRTEQLDGSFEISSTPNNGVYILIQLPIIKRSKSAVSS